MREFGATESASRLSGAMAYEYANQIGKATALVASTIEAVPQSTVGKQTLAQQEVVDPAAVRLARVRAQAGRQLRDSGGFEYVVTPEGGFAITFAPSPWERTQGNVITMTGKLATAWATLATLLDREAEPAMCVEPAERRDEPPAAPDLAMCLEPDREAAPERGEVPRAPQAPGEATPKQYIQEPRTDTAEAKQDVELQLDAAAAAMAESTDTYFVGRSDTKLRDDRGKDLGKTLPQHARVRVLETRPFATFTNARLATLDGGEIGWASLQHLTPSLRPKRPSKEAEQRAAVLAAARATAGGRSPHGKCYTVVKHHIINGGGYGDILHIKKDERFEGCTVPAVSFATAVERAGAAALGLEKVSGTPMSAPPGTILVLRGTAKNKISQEYGDISIIEGVRNGLLVCYNDGEMHVVVAQWAERWADSLVAMYKPIDRS